MRPILGIGIQAELVRGALVVDLVEQLVQGDEVRPFDVPVGLFGLRWVSNQRTIG